jgi:thiamine transport system permease protein
MTLKPGFWRSYRSRQTVWQVLIWLIPLAFLAIFFYQPLVAIFKLIFSPQFASGWLNFNLQDLTKPFGFTLFQATLSTTLTLALGLPIAYMFSHFRFPGKKVLSLLSTLPFILPTVVVAAGFNALLGPRGWINLGLMSIFGLAEAPIHFLNSLGAILLAHVFYNTTIIIRIVSTAWSNQDQRLAQAARTLGASPWQVFREITLPLLRPSILAATLLVFLFDFTSFGVILMLGGPGFETIEVAIYKQAFYNLNLPMAGLLAIIQLLFTLVISIFYNRATTNRYSPKFQQIEKVVPKAPGSKAEKAWIAVLVIILIVLIISPLIALVARSFAMLEPARGERSGFTSGFTLAYYRELFTNRRASLFYVPPIRALQNSLLYAALTIIIALPMGFLLAYVLHRNSRSSRWLDPVIMLPLGTSAVTLGLGFLVVFNPQTWNRIGIPILIPIAHALIALPFVVRSILPTLKNIPPTLRESASSLGASPWQIFKEIDLPILFRSLLIAAIFGFTISLGEFGASSFITTPENPTIPVAIYSYISQPGGLNYGQALAMSTLLLIVCTLGIFLIEKVRLPGEEVF